MTEPLIQSDAARNSSGKDVLRLNSALEFSAVVSPVGASRRLTRRNSANAGIDLDASIFDNVTSFHSSAAVPDKSLSDDAGKTTLNETTINASLTLIGAGVLGVPYAFGQAGLLSGILMLLIASICGWTAILIGQLMETTKPLALLEGVPESLHNWAFLGFAAFGKAGRSYCNAVFVSELWFAMIALLVMNGINLNIVFPGHVSVAGGIVLCGVASFALLFPSAKLLSYFSVFGILSTVLAVGSLIGSAEVMDTWQIQIDVELVNWDKVPMSLGIFQFCFVAHSIFPSLYRGMENPSRDYKPAMVRSFTFAGLFYVIVGMIAFAMYGSHAQSSFMQNLGRELDLAPIPGKAFLYIICSACFAINLQATFPLIAMGLIASSEDALGISGNRMLRVIWKAAFMAGTTLVAVALRKCMSPVQSLVGCFCASNTCLLLPMVCGLKLLPMGFAGKTAAVVFSIYGIYILVDGTYENVLAIMDMLNN